MLKFSALFLSSKKSPVVESSDQQLSPSSLSCLLTDNLQLRTDQQPKMFRRNRYSPLPRLLTGNPRLAAGLVFLIMMMNISCKKEAIKMPSVASLTVTNAIVGAPAIRVGNIIRNVANNNYAQLSVMAGESNLYVWPVGDSAHPYFQQPKFYAEDRGVYSLFLAGQIPNVTGIVLQDKMPYHTDSTCGIRIINLSPNSPTLNITLLTSPTVNEVSNLDYLQYTDFKLYAAKAANTSYTFQLRKATDNSLLTSFRLSTPRFTNVTLVIRGMVGSNLGILRVNNDR